MKNSIQPLYIFHMNRILPSAQKKTDNKFVAVVSHDREPEMSINFNPFDK